MESEKSFFAKPLWVFLTAMLCCALWGSAFPCIKIGYSLFHIGPDDVMSRILFAGVRFILAGVLTIAIGSIGNRKPLIPKGDSWKRILVLSLLQTVLQYYFFYEGLAGTTGIKSSIINASSPFFSILLACLVYRQERLTFRKLAGCAVGFVGVAVINLNGVGSLSEVSGFALTGEGFILISVVFNSLSSVVIKKYTEHESPVLLSGYQFLLGGAILTSMGLLGGGSLHAGGASAYLLLCYMGVLSAVAYTLWTILLRYNPVSLITLYGLANPVFGVLLSAAFLGEFSQISWVLTLVSLVLVSGGMIIVKPKDPQNPESR